MFLIEKSTLYSDMKRCLTLKDIIIVKMNVFLHEYYLENV